MQAIITKNWNNHKTPTSFWRMLVLQKLVAEPVQCKDRSRATRGVMGDIDFGILGVLIGLCDFGNLHNTFSKWAYTASMLPSKMQ